ncbi:hypothetical protein [Clostridium sp. UBA7503]
METLFAFIPMLIVLPIILLFWGLGLYVLILVIKALKIYINKNS